MLIKRNVYFSQIDENGEEKLFSTTEKDRYQTLKETKSKRGYGRALNAAGGISGTYVGKKVADKMDERGAKDKDILKGSTAAGLATGAGVGAGLVTGSAAITNKVIGKFVKKTGAPKEAYLKGLDEGLALNKVLTGKAGGRVKKALVDRGVNNKIARDVVKVGVKTTNGLHSAINAAAKGNYKKIAVIGAGLGAAAGAAGAHKNTKTRLENRREDEINAALKDSYKKNK